mgnify:CR=1 FL=1
MTWDYYDIKKVGIKKGDGYNMSMGVECKLERDGEPIFPEDIGLNERELHSTIEDVLQELIGNKVSSTIEDEEGSEIVIDVEIKSVSENR